MRRPFGIGVLSLAVWSCTTQPSARSYLRVALFSPYTSLDPLYARDLMSVWLTQQLFEGLLTYDDSLRLSPALAERYEVLEGGRRYRFYLRQNTYHHRPDRPVRAADVIYNWHRLASPKWASPGSYLFDGLIEGWNAYRQGQADTISGLIALSPSVVEVRLEKPYALFPYLLTVPYTYIALPESVEAHGRRFAEHPVGTGPFCLQYEEPGQLVVLRRHKYQRDTTSLPGIAFQWFGNRLWAYEAMKRGEIDAIEGIDRNLAYLLRSDSSWTQWATLLSEPALGIEYLGINMTSQSVLKETAVRQALAWTLFRLPVAEVVHQGHATPAQSFVPPMLTGSGPHPPDPPDSIARSKLRQTELTLYAPPSFRELCEYIQSRLAREGITLRIEYLLGPSLREHLQKAPLPLWKASWIADFPDAENFLILFESDKVIPHGPNTTHFQDRKVDSLLALARVTLDLTQRKALYAEIERQVLTQWPVIPLYHPHNVWLVRSEWVGFPRSRLSVWFPLHEVRRQVRKDDDRGA